MAGMMNGASTGAWTLLWIFLGLVVIGAGVMAARTLSGRRESGPPRVSLAESPAVAEAKDALKLRYAHGEISREDYLQGKVELED